MTVDEFYPDASHNLLLWQLFLVRVHPLTKVLHPATVEPYVHEAANKAKRIPLSYSGLLFAIYIMAILSTTQSECSTLFGASRDSLMKKFVAGAKGALAILNFLENYDMVCLQTVALCPVRRISILAPTFNCFSDL